MTYKVLLQPCFINSTVSRNPFQPFGLEPDLMTKNHPVLHIGDAVVPLSKNDNDKETENRSNAVVMIKTYFKQNMKNYFLFCFHFFKYAIPTRLEGFFQWE